MFNTTEIEKMGDSTDIHEVDPTWTETVGASFDNYQATSNYLSEYSYKRDALDDHLDSMTATNSAHSSIYEKVKSLSPHTFEKYERANNLGTLETVLQGEIFKDISFPEMSKYFDDVKEQKTFGFEGIFNTARGEAAKDFYESQAVLERSEYMSAEFVGAAGGFMTDPTGLAEIAVGFTPVGASAKVGSLAYRAGTAAAKEMGLAIPFEFGRQSQKMDWSEQVGVKHDIKDAATEAVIAVGAAGAFRGTAEAVFDLLPLGQAKLREADPDLADARDTLMKENISSSEVEHLDNLDRAEGGIDPLYKDPSEFVEELQKSPSVKEFEETPTLKPELVDYEGELGIVTGKTAEGEDIIETYTDMQAAEDAILEKISKIEDCFL